MDTPKEKKDAKKASQLFEGIIKASVSGNPKPKEKAKPPKNEGNKSV